MSLSQIVDNSRTDKNTTHSYLELYQELFSPKKDSAKNILEIGMGDSDGSIKLWNDFFLNAKVHAISAMKYEDVWQELKNKEKILLYTSSNAYDENFFNTNFLYKKIKFDILIDDGPHTLHSMKLFLFLYSQLLADDGILIIEDVQHIDWLDELKECVPKEMKKYIKVYDRRKVKNRYDDIIFTIDRTPPSYRNIVIVTSIVDCSNKISVYTKEERLTQTINTIETIRKNIPNSYIIFSDLEEYKEITALVDKTIHNENIKFSALIKSFKQVGDFLLFRNSLEYLPTDIPIKNVFKISGRYWLNETFSYADYDHGHDCFRITDPDIWKKTVTTCFFKVAFTSLENIKKYMDAIYPYFSYLASHLSQINTEHIFYTYTCLNEVKHIHNLGVSGYISVSGLKGSA